MKNQNPFIEVDTLLRNIETRVVDDKTVNMDEAKKILSGIVQEFEEKKIADHSIKIKKQAIRLGNQVQTKLDGKPLQKDSRLLFHRRTTAKNGIFDDISDIFHYELCGVPLSLFETTAFPREVQKSTLEFEQAETRCTNETYY